jgi:copper(I)-binding protein
VVFASDVDATKLVGAPSLEVKSGGVVASAVVDDAGVGAVFGTRRNDQHADAPSVAVSIQTDAFRSGGKDRRAL